jgi:hypothetical protein
VTEVLLLALVASLDAGLLAIVVVLLAQPRPERKLLAFLIGCMGLSVAAGIVIVLALKGSGLAHHLGGSISPGIEAAVGLLLISVAVTVASGRAAAWRERRHARSRAAGRPEAPSLAEKAAGRDSVWIAWAVGAAYSLPGASYAAGLALLVKLRAGTVKDVVAIIIFNVVMFALVELPLLGFLLSPDRTRALTGRFNEWMARRRRTIVVVVAGAVGAYLLVSGLSKL